MALDEALAVSRQVPELADRLWRNEASPQEAVLQQLSQPRRVFDVGFATREDLHVAGVHQHELEALLFEDIPDRLPILPGRLHHDVRHGLLFEPAGELFEVRGERGVRADLAASPARAVRGAHAADDLVLSDVEPTAALVDDLHRWHLLGSFMRCPAGPTEITTLKGVLKANSSRCREGPCISLTNGLSRTKESRAWPGTNQFSSVAAALAMGV